MKFANFGIVFTAVALAAATHVAAQVVIYPAKGQSAQQQSKDKFECQEWATQQTGFDPLNVPSGSTTVYAPRGQVVRGGTRGAALGAVGGAVAGNAAKGAAAGAAVGATHGAMKRADARRTADAQAQQLQQSAAQQRGNWDKHVSACMEGRGYTVK